MNHLDPDDPRHFDKEGVQSFTCNNDKCDGHHENPSDDPHYCEMCGDSHEAPFACQCPTPGCKNPRLFGQDLCRQCLNDPNYCEMCGSSHEEPLICQCSDWVDLPRCKH